MIQLKLKFLYFLTSLNIMDEPSEPNLNIYIFVEPNLNNSLLNFFSLLGGVWIHVAFVPSAFPAFSLFFFFCCSTHFRGQQLLFMHCSWTVTATFDYFNPQISLFINFFIKNGSHGTIHTFKNYFTTVFSVFSFSKINSIQTDL